MLKFAFVAVTATLLAACASQRAVPPGYIGPTAIVYDSSIMEDRSKSQIFALVEVEGRSIENSFLASANASSGQGFRLTTKMINRQVPAKPMKVTIRAAHATGAPIHAIFGSIAGTVYSVEGTVDFSPEATKTYVVRGELTKERTAVWIEDNETNRPVTEKVVNK